MIFSSYTFLLGFFPIVVVGYWGLNHFRFHNAAKILLIVASFWFYAQGSPSFFPFFMASVLGNYILGSTMCTITGEEQKAQRKLLLFVGIMGNLALLGYYKYMNFFLENVHYLTGADITLRKITLPIGISFFTFQLIAYLADCYAGEAKSYNVIEYLLFITFFPQLIVGPIVHHSQITPQFADDRNMVPNARNIALGIFIFAIGCGKKMLLADPMNETAAAFYATAGRSSALLDSWFYTLQYSLSYYFDLSGYTDMAIGLGLFFNIRLPENFNAPWKSRNMQQYWQRQHMTLSRFLGGYVFKNVYRKGSKWRNYYVATVATFLVSGIWHGAGWNFIVWGLINGLLVCIGAWEKYHDRYLPYPVGVVLTFFGIILTRVIFVATGISQAAGVYLSMFDFKTFFANGAGQALRQIFRYVIHHQKQGILVAAGMLICYLAPTTRQMADKFKPDVRHFLFAAVLLGICLLRMNHVVQFLYFQF